ncbi:MAG: glycerophosphoryl diester phosphodiesterase membrane domain-containing protein [Bacteroidota bacterium]
MKLGDIFDQTFTLIGSTWSRALLVCVIILVPASFVFIGGMDSMVGYLLDLGTQAAEGEPDVWSGEELDPAFSLETAFTLLARFWLFILALCVLIAATFLAMLGVTIIACAEMAGVDISWSEALRRSLGIRAVRLLVQLVLQGAVFVALFLIPFLMIIGGAASDTLWLSLFGGLGVAVAAFATIFLAIRWAFTMQAIGWEEEDVIGAFQRSWQLVSQNWWRVFGILILLGLLEDFVVSIITMPIYFLAMWNMFVEIFHLAGSGAEPGPEVHQSVFSSIGLGLGLTISVSMILSAFLTPLYTAVLYYDLRVRRGEFPPPASTGPAGTPLPGSPAPSPAPTA